MLQAISASSSDRTSLLEFLQRRKLEANKVPNFLLICALHKSFKLSMMMRLLDKIMSAFCIRPNNYAWG